MVVICAFNRNLYGKTATKLLSFSTKEAERRGVPSRVEDVDQLLFYAFTDVKLFKNCASINAWLAGSPRGAEVEQKDS